MSAELVSALLCLYVSRETSALLDASLLASRGLWLWCVGAALVQGWALNPGSVFHVKHMALRPEGLMSCWLTSHPADTSLGCQQAHCVLHWPHPRLLPSGSQALPASAGVLSRLDGCFCDLIGAHASGDMHWPVYVTSFPSRFAGRALPCAVLDAWCYHTRHNA